MATTGQRQEQTKRTEGNGTYTQTDISLLFRTIYFLLSVYLSEHDAPLSIIGVDPEWHVCVCVCVGGVFIMS